MSKKQNEAQRLAAELLKGKTFPAYPVMPLTEAAFLLLRQDKLLEQASDALRALLPDKRDDNHDGHDARDVRTWRATLAAIRAHREAK